MMITIARLKQVPMLSSGNQGNPSNKNSKQHRFFVHQSMFSSPSLVSFHQSNSHHQVVLFFFSRGFPLPILDAKKEMSIQIAILKDSTTVPVRG